MNRILIIQSQMKRYRLPFFTKLHEKAKQHCIEVRVAYGIPPESEGRKDNCDLPLEFGIRTRIYRLPFGRLFYFPLLTEVFKADLIISEQANRQVLNYLLILFAMAGIKKVAFWGLGENRGKDRSEFSEWLRKRIAGKVDWWFAYTPGTESYLVSNGVRREQITVVRNAIDTHEIQRMAADLGADEIKSARVALGLGAGADVGVFVGALLPDKGIEVLLRAAELAKPRLLGFHLLVVGGGPEEYLVREASKTHPWIHPVGPKFGKEKVILLKIGSVLLMPGRVGLAILDGFAAGLPLLTTEIPNHGPEIEYLQRSHNGMTCANNPEAYAELLVSFFTDTALKANLVAGAEQSASQFSVDQMADNFMAGIQSCLNPAA